MRLIFPCLLLVACSPLGNAVASSVEPEADNLQCLDGAYRLADGSVLEIRLRDEERAFLHHWSGTAARLARSEHGWEVFKGYGNLPSDLSVQIGNCTQGLVSFEGIAATRIALKTVDTRFSSGDVELAGRLTLPASGKVDTLMVLGHGSERLSAIRLDYHQRLYAAMGIATFAYDKRGTGNSSGRFSANFEQLADDLAAASREAQRLLGSRPARVGYRGTSQAGWIIPLAAEREPADFAIVATGVAESPMYEDRNEVLRSLRERGYGDDVLAKARILTAATARIIHSNFSEGFDEYDEVRSRFAGEPWLEHAIGDFTQRLIPYSGAQLRAYAEANPQEEIGMIWDHDARAVLSRMTTPLLWLLAQEDREGASDETKTTLVELACSGRPFTLIDYPNADHGVRYYVDAPNGQRSMTDYAPSVYSNELSFARHGTVPNTLPDAIRLATDC